MHDPAFLLEAPPIVYWNSNPYAIVFSPDGRRLAIGAGGWYGLGGISMVDVESQEERTLRFLPPDSGGEASVLPPEWGEVSLTVSGLAFDDRGEHLAACAWTSSQHAGPALLFHAQGLDLRLREAYILPEHRAGLDGGPTGICFDGDRLRVRSNARRLEDVLATVELPFATQGLYAHRSHARIARIGDELITGGGGSLKLGGWSRTEGDFESFKATTGLVVGLPARGIPAPGERITAVLARPGGGLLTGGLGGEIIAWERREAGWRPVRRVREPSPRQAKTGGAWATYRPESVVGLCALEDGRFFSVDANGEALEWRDEVITRTFTAPRPGTARCIAVHPETPRGPLLAVGMKVVEGVRRGYVACWKLS